MNNLSLYQWQLPHLPDNTTQLIDQLKEAGLNYSPAFLRVCISRGLTSKEQIEQATDPTPQLFHDAYLMYDMAKAVQRIMNALETNEKILVYGDYDADGITSTLIVVEALESLGANVTYHLPNRFTDGYGPNLSQYQRYINEEAVDLIITVDNGVAGFEALQWAKEQQIDVIVTDHHEIQEELPPSYAFIHPQHPNGKYPFKDLAGAGVALKLVTALLQEVPPEALELAAIGTVADMVSLSDENRTIVLAGLSIMKDTSRTGLAQFFKEASINPLSLNADTIGFQIGPRLNALGRLDDPTPGLELLKTHDPIQAKELLDFMNDINQERKDIVEQILKEIDHHLTSVSALPKIITLASNQWPAGVLGIVAGRVTHKYQRPAIIFQYIEEEKIYKGSARSIEAVNIFELLSSVKEDLLYFGGHAQAAGLTIQESQFDIFKKNIELAMIPYEEAINRPETLNIDLVASLDEVDLNLVDELQQLGPFGMSNPKPNVLIEQSVLKSKQLVGVNRQHVKCVLSEGENTLDAIGFSMSDRFVILQEGQTINMVGQLSINEWQERKTVQLMIEDIGVKGAQWIDQRSSRIPSNFFNIEKALFLFKTPRLLKHYKERMPQTSQGLLYSDELEETITKDTLVFVEPPESIHYAKVWVESFEGSQIIIGAFVHQSKYLIGSPNRQDFATVYRWLQKQQPFVLTDQLSDLSRQFKIELPKLITIFHVFLQANFVTIDKGEVTFQPSVQQEAIDLTQLPAMLAYLDEMKAEQLFVYSDFQELVNYFISK